ncbi:TetR/AcrR family transcriptional regulator [Leptospira biflexa]|jgi:AcrR family transcriptional regulator|uniref:Putative transcriptional regulator n=1 Tax=Leptospira biflexa serovar Patoc (strain Patoc 1 / ATCC 23582 / Paris) TaxID=456481 RepID=B0SL00_LEPBP|nr:TetR-like C-terminal domain-containing protein [Leptospira biflexa]ABZ94824.1 Transcriptional regulator, AcrR-family [Leptospira biflexa serovar Patoc strain 'Patoc 1 (Ames)']ABZ98493.1 Putative transcriptional regulator [Leptospira biflexa serovar Patoc strain 'Patoc 1 (Paris)']TGM44009.1 TetR/AcrR family transcriptional regulator [Leptospira biflexa]TGM44986.1 TetR/AcrR family transcriptional regulator [Leptospira biflexa]
MAKKIKSKLGRPKKGQTQINRSLVLDLAWDTIQKVGFSDFRLSTLAEVLGIRTPSLYNHVTDINDIFREMKKRALRLLGDRLEAVSKLTVGNSGRISQFLKTYRGFSKDFPHMYPLVIVSTELDPELKVLGDRILQLSLDAFQMANLDKENIHKIRIIRSFVHGFIDLEREGGFGRKESIEESFQKLTESLETGKLW